MLHVRWDHVLRWHGLFSSAGFLVFVFILVIVSALSPEVCWSFVLVWSAILETISWMTERPDGGFTYVGISRQRLANVSR
jgi:hypothetical protein